MFVVGIDPGNEKSAVVVYDSVNDRVDTAFIDRNEQILLWINDNFSVFVPYCMIGIERVESYGMAVGETVFETVHWAGRFHQAIINRYKNVNIKRIKRHEIKMHLCHTTRAKDTNIRQVLIDRFGPPGNKKTPGKTYGVIKDMWAALAVAVVCFDKFASDVAF